MSLTATRPFRETLPLENDGQLSLFFVGAGSAFTKKNFQTNLLVVKGRDHLLIDCGSLCSYALASCYNTPITAIKNFFISHSHADHIGGVEEVSLLGRYATKSKPNLVITDDYKKIFWDMSIRGGCANGERHGETGLTFDDYFNQIKPALLSSDPRPLYEAAVGCINIKIYRTMHMPDSSASWKDSFYSAGVLIDDKILFPSDTRFDLPLLRWMDSTAPLECIFHDCQLYSPGGVHTSYDELKTVPEAIKRKMYLCHYGDNFEQFAPQKDGFAGFALRGVWYDFD